MDRALLVGIDAYPRAPLRGCVNDVADMANHLVFACGFRTADIRLLTDERASTFNIRERLQWLISGLRAGDRALFHYSGHGAEVAARGPSGELVGLHQVLCPVDFDWSESKMIYDEELHQIFNTVPEDAELTWITDACHAGGFDGNTENDPRIRRFVPPRDIAWRSRAAADCGLVPPNPPRTFTFLAACAPNQTTSDITVKGRHNGAFTYHLLQVLRDRPDDPLAAVFTEIGERLRKAGCAQEPQLRGSVAVAACAFLTRLRVHEQK